MNDKETSYGKRNIYKNSIMSLIYRIGSACLSLISAPLLLNCLGDEKYGAYVTMLSIISWVYYCDLGIGNGLRNKLAESIAVEDYLSSKKYLATAYVLISGISFLIFGLSFIIFCVFDVGEWIGISLSGESVSVCLIVAMLLACINFVISLVNNVLFALQKAGDVNLFSCLSQVIFVGFLVFYIITGIETVFYIALGEGISQLLKNVIESVYVFKKNSHLKFSVFRDYDTAYTKGILSFGLQIFLVQIAALILNSTDNLVITKLLGSASVTPYSFCYKFFNMIQTMYVALTAPLLSAYTAAYTLNDVTWIYKTLKKNILLFGVFAVGSIFAVLVFKPFALMWLHRDLQFDTRLIFGTFLYFVLLMFSHVFSTFLTGISCIKETTIATVIGTIINIPVSIFLAIDVGMGVSGVIMGSVISLLLSVIVAPIVSVRELRKMRK